MTCVFCNSAEHFSQNCEIYVSDESRKKILKTKKFCAFCLYHFDPNHKSLLCKYYQKCYSCFSKGHHAAFCPDRFNCAKIFIPKIDKILLQRFSDMFDPLEQLTLAVSSTYENIIFIKPKKFINTVSISMNKKSKQILQKKMVVFFEAKFIRFKIGDIIANVNVMFHKLQKIEIIDSTLWSKSFLHLLSPNTKELLCLRLKLIPEKLSFADVLQNVPNIEIIELIQTNIKIYESWPEDILKHKNGNNLEGLTLTLDDPEFSAENLAAVIKTKSKPNVSFCFRPNLYNYGIQYNFCRLMKRQLSSHFMQLKRSAPDTPTIVIDAYELAHMTLIDSDDKI